MGGRCEISLVSWRTIILDLYEGVGPHLLRSVPEVFHELLIRGTLHTLHFYIANFEPISRDGGDITEEFDVVRRRKFHIVDEIDLGRMAASRQEERQQ